jgi:hypothetical protein
MPVKINDYAVLPAPIVTFGKNFVFTDDGTPIGANYSIELAGTLLQNKGNPISVTGSGFSSSFSNDAWTNTQTPDDDPLHGVGSSDLLISTITKIERLRELLSPPTGVKVEIVGFDHDKGLKFYGNVNSFSVASEGNWAKPANYTVSLSCNSFIESANQGLFSDGSSEDAYAYYVNSVKETWNFVEDEKVVVSTGDWSSIYKVYNISHNVDAKGKLFYGASGEINLLPWQQASGYVRSHIGLGISNMPNSLLGVSSGYLATNHKLTESIDRYAGTYAVEETFSYVPSGHFPSGHMAFDDCQISVERGEGSLTSVNIQGTIVGIETNSPTSADYAVSGVSKYTNALNYYNVIEPSLYSRVRQNAGLTWLHPTPKSYTIGKMPNAGSISYNYGFDDRPPNLIPGSVSEEIVVNDVYPGQIFSVTPVIGRNQPILQYLGSRSEYRRTMSININMGRMTNNWTYNDINSSGVWTSVTAANVRNWFQQKPSITKQAYFQTIYDAINPANDSDVISSKVFYSAPQESWNPKLGTYSYSIEWAFEKT